MLIQETKKEWIVQPDNPDYKNDIAVIFIDGSTHLLGEIVREYKAQEKPKDTASKNIALLWAAFSAFKSKYDAHQHLDIENTITSKPHTPGDSPIKTWIGEK